MGVGHELRSFEHTWMLLGAWKMLLRTNLRRLTLILLPPNRFTTRNQKADIEAAICQVFREV